MKRSVFVIIQRTDSGHILCVWNAYGSASIPGGKAECYDRDDFSTLQREFEEEIQQKLPIEQYDHFEWGNEKHVIRMYFARINPRTADKLCRQYEVRQNDDPDEHIAHFQWLPPIPTGAMQHHVKHGLRIWAEVDTRRRLY